MHKVYRNSYCNIAAADAKDSTGGLFRERVPRGELLATLDAPENSALFGKQRWRVVRSDIWEHGLLKRPLYTRGWVYQGRSFLLGDAQTTYHRYNACLRRGSFISASIRSFGTVQP